MENDEQKKRNKTAVALEYNPGEEAPKILATGKGLLAEKIIEKAREAAVPVHKDAKLARTLANLEVGDYIPPELYQAVAEVLLFVDNLDRIKEKAYNNLEE
jgi:flagellar biosynthesis protein